MSLNIKAIKLTLWLSIIFLFLTFIATLSSFYGWIKNVDWINDFLLVCFSGLFASSFVVFICEVQKYRLNKKQAEDSLFGCCTQMLIQFTTAETTLQKFIKNKKEAISTEILSLPTNQIQTMINYYNNIEYVTYCEEQSLYLARKDFVKHITDRIQPTLRNCNYLVMAINEAKIENLNKGLPSCQVTSEDKNSFIVINALLKEFEDCMSKIREFLEKVDYSKRYNVKEMFSNIQKSLDNFQDKNYQDYINEHTSL